MTMHNKTHEKRAVILWCTKRDRSFRHRSINKYDSSAALRFVSLPSSSAIIRTDSFDQASDPVAIRTTKSMRFNIMSQLRQKSHPKDHKKRLQQFRLLGKRFSRSNWQRLHQQSNCRAVRWPEQEQTKPFYECDPPICEFHLNIALPKTL